MSCLRKSLASTAQSANSLTMSGGIDRALEDTKNAGSLLLLHLRILKKIAKAFGLFVHRRQTPHPGAFSTSVYEQ